MRFAPRDFRLLIGVHTHGQITPPFAQSLAILTGQLAAWGVAHGVLIVQDCFVTSGRDRLAAETMAGDYTHLLMLDADLEFEPSDVGRLMAAGKDIVAGAYRRKDDSGRFAMSFLGTPEEGAPFDNAVGALEVDGIGAGFMLVRREVFEQMAEALEIAFCEKSEGKPDRTLHAFFEQKVMPNGQRISEDILFCRRWREMGGKVWAISDLRLRHWGAYAWEGSLADAITLIDVAAE